MNGSEPLLELQMRTLKEALELAVQHQMAGEFKKAEIVFQQILQEDPDQPQVLHFLGVIAHQEGNNEKAVDLISAALSNEPGYVEAHFNLANSLKKLRRFDEAIESYKTVLKFKPDYLEALNNLGNTLNDIGNPEEAVSYYEKAIRIKSDKPELHNNLGNTYKRIGKLNRAISSFETAINIKSDYSEAYNNLGVTADEIGRPEEALLHFKMALTIEPNSFRAYNNQGNALRKLRRIDAAIKSFEKALYLNPEMIEGHNNLGIAKKDIGELSQSLECFQRALEIDPHNMEAQSNFLMNLNYGSMDQKTLFEKHYLWGIDAQNSNDLKLIKDFTNLLSEKKLHIGFISGDFRAHSVSYFLSPFFSNYDSGKLKVHCYSNSNISDETTKKFRKLVHQWNDIAGWSDQKVINKIKDDRISILVDLSGHTSGNRLTVFSKKPAPLQVTWIGYPNTTGLTSIDYRLSDLIADPPGVDDEFYTEKLIRLPNGFLCYMPPEDTPELAPPPFNTNKIITFGCFNNLAKINLDVLNLWKRILEALPESRLLLKSPVTNSGSIRKRFTDFFKDTVEPKRVRFESWKTSVRSHLKDYNNVDIALDTFPYNGTTTTCEALWMGVPVITLSGERHASRIGASLLTRIGLSNLVAINSDDYHDITLQLAKDRVGLRILRAGMRNRMRESPLCDAISFSKDIEAAYQNMWREWCDNQ